MEYDAITLDTNIFDQNGLHLEGGLLQQLNQFHEGSVEFILSEVVIREVLGHLRVQAQDALDRLRSAIRKARSSGVLTEEAAAKAGEIRDTASEAKTAATARLDKFIKDTTCAVVLAHDADMKQLIEMYFDAAAPFEVDVKKKSEFPDAIAL
jgi:hypothetical protein